ncbi:MAG: hypothetical protein JOZ70_10595 [Pseudolabrys sp.]|nr:hypothetical protein [Pseudolabrys sp.]MBV9955688.1 hypothetical protein [Pseudolabrys sp.]
MQAPAEHPYPRVERALEAIADWVNRYRRTQADQQFLTECSPQEVEHMARDLGVSHDDLVRLVPTNPNAAALLDKLLKALGVENIAQQNPAVLNDLKRLCVFCGEKERCAHELEVGAATAHYKEYCPNAYTLDSLVVEKGVQHKSRR